MWIYHILFTHSSVDRYLNYSHFLVIMNNAAINILLLVFNVDMCFQFSWIYREVKLLNCSCFLFLKSSFIFREQGREGEKHQLVVCCTAPTGDMARNPGMYPDWESNQQPFGSQASTQSTEPHQPEQIVAVFLWSKFTEGHVLVL